MAGPERFTLPSGARAVFSSSVGAGVAVDDFARLSVDVVDANGRALSLPDLALADAHTLRVIAMHRGDLLDPAVSLRCCNCEAVGEVTPARTFELGPYLDAELDDPELDARFEFGVPCEVSGSGSTRYRIQLAPRTWAEAAPLRRAACAPGGLRITSEVVRALGLASVADEADPRRLARRLDRDDGLFAAVSELFERAHYPARLVARHACAACGAVEVLALPTVRELSVHGDPDAASDEPFVTDDRFEAWALAAAQRHAGSFERVTVIVEHGTPDVDDDGVPLLGSYTPGESDQGEIRLYFRTFRAQWRDGGPYDVYAEIEETVRHELEHHVGHLRGADPLDDEEHAEIDDAYQRRVGRSEARRRAARQTGRDLGGFVRATWWLWLLAAAIAWLASRSDAAP